MKTLISNDQRGIGHLGLILAVVVVLGIGGVGYFVYNKNKNSSLSTADSAVQEALKNAKCEYDDKDLCKFFASYKVQKYFTINTVSEADGKKTNMLIKTEGSDKSYMKIDGETPYEVVTIGKTIYTKATSGTWWKQVTAETDSTTANLQDDAKTDFEEPSTTESSKTTYKKIGKEKCDNLTCFKYQQIEPNDPSTTTYLWFDDKDYQVRRTQTTSSDSTSDSTYSYAKVSISEPTPVKELGENQYLMPGASEPTTLPAAGDVPTEEELRKLMEQYQ